MKPARVPSIEKITFTFRQVTAAPSSSSQVKAPASSSTWNVISPMMLDSAGQGGGAGSGTGGGSAALALTGEAEEQEGREQEGLPQRLHVPPPPPGPLRVPIESTTYATADHATQLV